MFKKISSLIIALVFSSTAVFAATYEVDNVHSQVHFKVAHLVVATVRGEFTDYTATINADPSNRTVQNVEATIKVASIDTRNQKRDDHLRSADFFDAGNHPNMTFKSTKIEGKGDDITVYGDLTIRGNTRQVALKGDFRGEVKDPWGNTKAGFSASTTINRQDYGLTWSKTLETGGLVVGNEVEIGLEIEALRAK
jgi:polyisoprenoid-binding protein YceI